MLKPLPVWITTNCGKFLKRWEYQTTLLVSWDIYMQIKKQQLEPDMEQGCILSLWLFNLYAEYIMWNAGLDEAQVEIKFWEQYQQWEICRWYHPNGRKYGERREWKSWLKTQLSKNEDHDIQTHHFMTNTWGKLGNSNRFYFLGLQNHCRWWLQPWS